MSFHQHHHPRQPHSRRVVYDGRSIGVMEERSQSYARSTAVPSYEGMQYPHGMYRSDDPTVGSSHSSRDSKHHYHHNSHDNSSSHSNSSGYQNQHKQMMNPPHPSEKVMSIRYYDDNQSAIPPRVILTQQPGYNKNGEIYMGDDDGEKYNRNWCLTFLIIFIVLGCLGAFGAGIYFSYREANPFNPTSNPTPSPVSFEIVTRVPTPLPTLPSPTTMTSTPEPTTKSPIQTPTRPTRSPTRSPTRTPTRSPMTTPTLISTSTAMPTQNAPIPNTNNDGNYDNNGEIEAAFLSFFSNDFLNTFLPAFENQEFYWIELLHYRETADYEDGLVTTVPGRSSDDAYKAWRGRQINNYNENKDSKNVIQQLYQNDLIITDWYDEIVIIQYPSGRAFVESMLQSDELVEYMTYRLGGCDAEKSQWFATQLAVDSVPALLREAPSLPPSGSGEYFLHTIKYRAWAVYDDDENNLDSSIVSGRDAMAKFDELSTPLKYEYGFRAAAWFQVKSMASSTTSNDTDGDDNTAIIDEIRMEYISSLVDYGNMLGQTEVDVPSIWEHREAALDPTSSMTSQMTNTAQDDSGSVALFNIYNNN